MQLQSARSLLIKIGIIVLSLVLVGYTIFDYTVIREWIDQSYKYIVNLTPAKKEIEIQNNDSRYQVNLNLSDFSKNTINELNLFDENAVFVNNKISADKHTLRNIKIIFSQEKQFWPLQIKRDNIEISSFNFAVDELGNGTLTIWINPNEATDPESLSIATNRAFFSALYIIRHWDTYLEAGSEYYDYLSRINNEINYSTIDNRPLVVQ